MAINTPSRLSGHGLITAAYARAEIMAFIYNIQDSDQRLHLSDQFIATIRRFRQTGSRPEAGGMLFARFALPEIFVELATIPQAHDLRSRLGFILHRPTKRRVIAKEFAKGLHYIGEWHTHPQLIPRPSLADFQSMRDTFSSSRLELNYLVMVILGYGALPGAIWVSIHNNIQSHTLAVNSVS